MLPIFGIFDIITAPFEWITSSVENGIVGIVLLAVGYLTKKYLLPYLKTEMACKMAEYILLIADEVTDQLVAKYPEKDVYKFLDAAIDKIIEVCGVKREVAERAVQAALGRKGLKKTTEG